ncbi:MAG TPA: glycosyltransferase family 2 protein [Gammaproteobacteria bacterium]|nr:glycosyltransferase family 2 protein [Gammaproteobacteria bacterium]
MNENKIAVIVPVHNRKECTLNCLRQLHNVDASGRELDVVIVDDGSSDGTSEAVREKFQSVIVLRGDGNLWWTGAINKGIEYALDRNYKGVLFLNDDLELDKKFLCELFSVVEENPGALVSSLKLRRTSGGDAEIITAGFDISGYLMRIVNRRQGEIYDEISIPEVETCDALTGAALYVPCQVISDIGLLDFNKFPHNWGDIEFTRRASLKGYKCLVATRSHIFTEDNPNYHRTYFIESSKGEYIRNMFDSHKFSYGFLFTMRSSFMHKPILVGVVCCMIGILRNIKNLTLKILVPNKVLRKFSS